MSNNMEIKSNASTVNESHVVVHKQLSNNAIILTSLLSGAIAGGLAKTTIAPLDRAKINFQTNKNLPYSAVRAIEFLRNTYRTEGFLALWRGNTATLARIIPYAAINFTAHEQWKKVLKVDGQTTGDDIHLRRFLAGSLAGVTSQSLTYPLDLARARMAVTHKEEYAHLSHVFKKIWTEEGPRTLFRGYIPTVLGVAPYAGVSFFTYDTLKAFHKKYTGKDKPKTITSLVFGAAAGALGQTSSYPLDIIRRRMQTSRPNVHLVQKTIWETIVAIYRQEGVRRGFFKGLSMNWVKGPIAVGISFSTYDKIRETLRDMPLFH